MAPLLCRAIECASAGAADTGLDSGGTGLPAVRNPQTTGVTVYFIFWCMLDPLRVSVRGRNHCTASRLQRFMARGPSPTRTPAILMLLFSYFTYQFEIYTSKVVHAPHPSPTYFTCLKHTIPAILGASGPSPLSCRSSSSAPPTARATCCKFHVADYNLL